MSGSLSTGNTSSVTAGAFTLAYFDYNSTFTFNYTDYLASTSGRGFDFGISDVVYDLQTFNSNQSTQFAITEGPSVDPNSAVPFLVNPWNWGSPVQGAGGTIHNFGPGVPNPGGQAIGASGSSDFWSLTVQLVSNFGGTGVGTTGNEALYLESFGGSTAVTGGSIAAGGASGASLSLHFDGNGGASLEALFHNLELSIPTIHSSLNVLFTLTDVGATAATYTNPTPLADQATAGNTIVWAEMFVSCYVSGTRIATPGGERAIESLAIGDRVMTATGKPRAIKWIGRSTHTAATVAAHPHLRPVLVRKDAIAAGMPHRDLSVSAMHALLIDDSFVPAAALVNGVSILRSDELAPVTYIHLELTEHDVVFAEGMPAETYVDDGTRQMFDNADEFYELYGADAGVTAFSAPRVEEGVQLAAIRQRLAARVGATQAVVASVLAGNVERIEDGTLVGWLADGSSAGVEFDVLADGELVGRAVANRYRMDLDYHGINQGIGGFSMALPASVTSLDQVCIRRAGDGARIGGRVEAVTV